MNSSPVTHRKLSRRQILIAVASAGMTAALGDALLTYPPWLDYDRQAKRTWDTPFRNEATMPAQMRELIRYATLATSGHNAQPWRFMIIGNMIYVLPDYSRRLPVVDPQDRELWISLGCALENMLIAAQHAGYVAEVNYPGPNTDYLAVRLEAQSAPNLHPLFEAIPHRANTRSLYDGHPVPSTELKKTQAVTAEAGVFPLIFTAPAQKEAILEYIRQGDQHQYNSQPFINELVSWLRFNTPEALHTQDGLFTPCSGNSEVPRWLGQMFITSGSAGKQSGTDETNVRSSSGLIVIASAQDDKRHWIETGRFYERLALTLTAFDIKMAFLNQPLEVTSLRSQFQSYLNIGAAKPQLLLRFGYAAPMPRSLRRPVEQVLT